LPSPSPDGYVRDPAIREKTRGRGLRRGHPHGVGLHRGLPWPGQSHASEAHPFQEAGSASTCSPVARFLTSWGRPSSKGGNHTKGMSFFTAYWICLPILAAWW